MNIEIFLAYDEDGDFMQGPNAEEAVEAYRDEFGDRNTYVIKLNLVVPEIAIPEATIEISQSQVQQVLATTE